MCNIESLIKKIVETHPYDLEDAIPDKYMKNKSYWIGFLRGRDFTIEQIKQFNDGKL